MSSRTSKRHTRTAHLVRLRLKEQWTDISRMQYGEQLENLTLNFVGKVLRFSLGDSHANAEYGIDSFLFLSTPPKLRGLR